MTKQKRVSDLIVKDEIQKWNDKKKQNKVINILISAGTDTGKSYFIKNDLYEYAREHKQNILFLIHRKDCAIQFLEEIKQDNKTDCITIATYQKAGTKNGINLNGIDDVMLTINDIVDINLFSYIVCDETHYFTGDSAFNGGTFADFHKIMSCKYPIKIFMSGTIETFKYYCTQHKIDFYNKYELSGGSTKIIKHIEFFYDDAVIQDSIDVCVKMNKKCIFFFDNLQKCYDYYKKYSDISMFNCSKSQKLATEIDIEKLNKLYQERKFDCQFLFTTICMDAGLNIVDPDLHNILCCVYDIDVLRQCIGRKRRTSDNDYINLRIRAYYPKAIENKTRNCQLGLKVAENFRKYGQLNYVEYNKGLPDKTGIILDTIHGNKIEKEVNTLQECKYRFDLKLAEIYKAEKHGYFKYIATKLGKPKKWTVLGTNDDSGNCDKLEQYLQSLIGRKLDKVAQEELINKVNHRVDGRIKTGLKSLNYAINNEEMENLPYIINSKIIKENKNGKRVNTTIWEVFNIKVS